MTELPSRLRLMALVRYTDRTHHLRMPTLTFYHFARPSFWEGMARVTDLGGTLPMYNDAATPAEADTLAFLNDWLVTGQDIQTAINGYERTIPATAAKK